MRCQKSRFIYSGWHRYATKIHVENNAARNKKVGCYCKQNNNNEQAVILILVQAFVTLYIVRGNFAFSVKIIDHASII